MKKLGLGLCLTTILLLIAGCGSADDPKSISVASIVQPVDYGNGVFYFKATRADFGKSLADFIGKNKSREVASIAGDGTDGYGYDRGYFVVTKER